MARPEGHLFSCWVQQLTRIRTDTRGLFLEAVDLVGFAKRAFLPEGDEADFEIVDAVHADRAAVLTAQDGNARDIGIVFGFGVNGSDEPPAIHVPQAVGDTKQYPVPFLIFGGGRNFAAIYRDGFRQGSCEEIAIGRSAVFVEERAVAVYLHENVYAVFIRPQ